LKKKEWSTLLKKIGTEQKWFISIFHEPKNEFYSVELLSRSGERIQKQYNDYLANGNKANTDEIVNAALAVGAVLLIGYLISEMFKGK
jgi:hypothetical protein